MEEKEKLSSEFNPQKFESSNNEGNKIFNWIKKHKIWSGIIILLLIGGIGSIFTDSENTESEEPKKETATKQEKKKSKKTLKRKKMLKKILKRKKKLKSH